MPHATWTRRTDSCTTGSVGGRSSESAANDDVDFSPHNEDRTPQLFTQIKLNDLVRDLGLTKEKSGILGPRLKEKIC
jgi:hypothetical protein